VAGGSRLRGRAPVPTLNGKIALLAAALLLAARAAGAAECRPLVDFTRYTLGDFPGDWKPKEDKAREIYRVLEQGGIRFIRATAQGTGLQIGREFDWDLEAHPVLAWQWRPQLLPAGADERDSRRNDSVLGVYAVFPHSPVSVKALKYVWSAVAPAGATATASLGLTRMLVLRSGPPEGGGWVEETVNVAQDYRRLFGEAPKQPRGIALLTDADDTRSAAVGDYTDFRVCSAPRAAAGPQGQPAQRDQAPGPARAGQPARAPRGRRPRSTAADGSSRGLPPRSASGGYSAGFFQTPRSWSRRIWRRITFSLYSACFMGGRVR
jgi:hypothetical protein